MKTAKLVEVCGCDVLSRDGEILKCISCVREMSYSRKSNINAHLKTPKHRNNLQDDGIRAGNEFQNSVGAVNADRKQFNLDLSEALVNAIIPI